MTCYQEIPPLGYFLMNHKTSMKMHQAKVVLKLNLIIKAHQQLSTEKSFSGKKKNDLVQPSIQSNCVKKYRQNILKIG